jgi:hypothetical protein
MPAAAQQVTLEIVVGSEGDPLAHYSDLSFDRATSLTVTHATGAVTVTLGKKEQKPAGSVSTRMASLLKGIPTILWARMEGENTVAITEIALRHA